jgi:transcriptional regulator with XRE-family HTH domain
MEDRARTRLARRIRFLRRCRGWSQEVLAELSGLHRSYIGSVERAERNISLDNIERIAHALGVPIRDLLAEPEGTPPAECGP